MSEDDEGQSIDIDILYDDLTYLYTNKINLNTATKEQLQRLQFLSDIQIENILRYVYTSNQMQTIYELQLVDGLDYFGRKSTFGGVSGKSAAFKRPDAHAAQSSPV